MEDDKTLVVKSKEGETISTSVIGSTVVEREEEENSEAMADDKMESTSTEVTKSKSKLFAYLLWFFLGWAGIHHFYLRRYRQGVLWLTSFGGLFGIGKAANNNPRFLIACLISYSKYFLRVGYARLSNSVWHNSHAPHTQLLYLLSFFCCKVGWGISFDFQRMSIIPTRTIFWSGWSRRKNIQRVVHQSPTTCIVL